MAISKEMQDKIMELLLQLGKKYGPVVYELLKERLQEWIDGKRDGFELTEAEILAAADRFQAKWDDPLASEPTPEPGPEPTPEPEPDPEPEPSDPSLYGRAVMMAELRERVREGLYRGGDMVYERQVEWQGSEWDEYAVFRPSDTADDSWTFYGTVKGTEINT